MRRWLNAVGLERRLSRCRVAVVLCIEVRPQIRKHALAVRREPAEVLRCRRRWQVGDAAVTVSGRLRNGPGSGGCHLVGRTRRSAAGNVRAHRLLRQAPARPAGGNGGGERVHSTGRAKRRHSGPATMLSELWPVIEPLCRCRGVLSLRVLSPTTLTDRRRKGAGPAPIHAQSRSHSCVRRTEEDVVDERQDAVLAAVRHRP
jgi:hypothetical protein